MDQDLIAEIIVGTRGIPGAFAKPKPITEAEMNKAARGEKDIKKRVGELFDLKRPLAQLGPPELPDYHETHLQLAQKADGDALAEIIHTIPVELQPACAFAWSNAIAYLDQIFPRRSDMLITGPKLYDPSVGEFYEFGWAWRISKDPLIMIDLMGEGMLIGIEVAHLKAMFPLIHAQVSNAIQDELSNRVAKDSEWSPSWWLHKQICTLYGVSPVSKTLLKDIDSAVQASSAAAKQRTNDIKMNAQTSTQSQRLADK
jgi:hypothetical protein